ncbi:MAG: STAS domain-containing protein [Clostridia bacterium]|nr:STAS domain-containing protein [Clostridia bacterium]
MNITTKKEENVCTLIIEGRIDTITAPELDKVFRENADGSDKMIFDMTGVDYISSAGIRTLVAAHRKMSGKSGLILRNPDSPVLSILKMTGIDKKLNIE